MTELSVCIGSSCHLKGSYNVIQSFKHMIEEENLHDKIKFKASFCMKECHKPDISVKLNGEIFRVAPENAHAFFKDTVLKAVK